MLKKKKEEPRDTQNEKTAEKNKAYQKKKTNQCHAEKISEWIELMKPDITRHTSFIICHDYFFYTFNLILKYLKTFPFNFFDASKETYMKPSFLRF